MTDQQAMVCSLSGPELAQRINEWAEVASQATSRHVEKGRVVSNYRKDEQLIRRLRKLIAAEAECCPFMQFSIEEHRQQVVVELRVPDDMSEVLAVMLGFVTQQPAPSPQAA